MLIVLCLAPVSQPAAALSSSAPVGMGKFVKGCCTAACAYTVGRIASPKNVRKAWDWFDDTLSDQVEDMGDSMKEGEQKIPAVFNKRFETQNAIFRSVVASYGLSREKNIHNKMFGSQSAAYAKWNRSDFLVGQGAGSALDARLRLQAKAYAEGVHAPKQVANRLRQISSEDITPRSVFPVCATLTKKQGRKLQISLKTIMDAFPATELPENYQDARYSSFQKARRLRSQIAEAVLSEVMAGYLPTMPAGEGIKKMWQASGGQGEPFGIENGRMSPVGYLGLLIRSRFANADYRTGKGGIHTMPQAGLLREMASIKALRLAIEQRQLRRSQQIAFMAAMQVSGKEAVSSMEFHKVSQTVSED